MLQVLDFMARLERFELPTARFVAEYSIQLSYRRIICLGAQLSVFVTIASNDDPVAISNTCERSPERWEISQAFHAFEMTGFYL